MKTISIFSSIALAGAAFAATQSYGPITVPGGFVSGATPSGGLAFTFSGQTVDLPQWNPALFPGQTLVGVTYTIVGYSYATYSIQNTDTVSHNGYTAALLATQVTLTPPTAGPVVTTQPNLFYNIPDTLTPLQIAVGTTSSVSDTDSDSDNSNLAAYTGAGNVTFTLAGAGNALVGGPTPFAGSAAGFGAAVVSIEYTYQETSVPEASTYAAVVGLLGMVSFGWARSRR